MKILYYSRPSFVDNDILLVRALQDLGHTVCFILKISEPHKRSSLFSISEILPTSDIIPASSYNELDWIREYVKCDFRVLNIPNFNSRKLNIRTITSIHDIVKSFSPDVFHFIGNPEDITDLFLIVNYRKQSVITLHDPIPHSGESNRNVFILTKIALKLTSKIILLNDKQTEQFIQCYSISSKKIFYSKLGYFEWIKLFVDAKKQESPYLLFYGRISPYKGIEYLLKALVNLKQLIPDIKAIIAGSGSYHFDVSQYHSLDYITFINRFIETKELATLISNSSFVICPYTDATQSGVVNTVLALGKPIIVTDVGALAENVQNGVNGLIIPPKDIKAIEDSITTLWNAPDLLDKMRMSIIESANNDASWNNIAQQTIIIYNSVIM